VLRTDFYFALSVWLLPTVIFVPAILVWTRKIMSGKKLLGMNSS